MVVSVGIDVSKDKHDCFIVSSDGDVLADVFTISNTLDGFHDLLQRIQDCATPQDKIKVGLEATGHYSYNLLGFLLDNGLTTYVLNPLRTNLYRKSLSLRKTKTDRVDARTIASMLLSDAGLKPYTNTAYHNEELKSLTRYRFDKVKERAKLKSSIARLVCIEVDGTGFHEAGSKQAERDMKKNSILEKCAVPLLRLRTDGSGEKEKIRNALKKE